LNSSISTASRQADRESRQYSYAHVFDHKTTDAQVFDHVWEQTAEKLQDGFNATVLCYGQTGSGKTYTLNKLLPSMVNECFSWLASVDSKCKAEVAYIQIHMDKVYDLLAGPTHSRRGGMLEWKGRDVPSLPRPFVEAKSAADAVAMVTEGSRWRATAAHALNDRSSRSHTLFFLRLWRDGKPSSTLTLADLAGSERVERTKTTGDAFEEGKAINKALTCLGRVIESLGTKAQQVPYRDNVLTMYLAESLTNSYFALICCCSSDARDADETRCTLQFGTAAGQVQIERRATQLLRMRADQLEAARKAREEEEEMKRQWQETAADLAAQAAEVQKQTSQMEKEAAEARARAQEERFAASRAEERLAVLREQEAVKTASADRVAADHAALRERHAMLQERALELKSRSAAAEQKRREHEREKERLLEEVAAARRDSAEAEERARQASLGAELLRKRKAEKEEAQQAHRMATAALDAVKSELEEERRLTAAAATSAAKMRAEEERSMVLAEDEEAEVQRLESVAVSEVAELEAAMLRLKELREVTEVTDRRTEALQEDREEAKRSAEGALEAAHAMREKHREAEARAEELMMEADGAAAAVAEAKQKHAETQRDFTAAEQRTEEVISELRVECESLAGRCKEGAEDLRQIRERVIALRAEAVAEAEQEPLLQEAVQSAASRCRAAEEETGDLSAECAEMAAQREAAEAALDEARAAVQKAARGERDACMEAEGAATELRELQAEVAQRNEELETGRRHLQKRAAVREGAWEDLESRTQRDRELHARIMHVYEEEHASLQETLKAAEDAAKERGQEEVEAMRRHAKLVAELGAATHSLRNSREQVDQLATTAAELRELVGQVSARSSLRQSVRDSMGEDLSKVEETLLDATTTSTFKAQVRADKIEALEAELLRRESFLADTHRELADAATRAGGLEEQVATMDARLATVSAKRQGMQAVLNEVSSTDASTPPLYSEAREIRAEQAEHHAKVLADVRRLIAAEGEGRALMHADADAVRVKTESDLDILQELREELNEQMETNERVSREEERVARELDQARVRLESVGANRQRLAAELEEERNKLAVTRSRKDLEVLAERVGEAEAELRKMEEAEEERRTELREVRKRHEHAQEEAESQVALCMQIAGDCETAMDGLCAVRTSIAEEREKANIDEEQIAELERQTRQISVRQRNVQEENKRLRHAHSNLRRESKDLAKKAAGASRARADVRKLSRQLDAALEAKQNITEAEKLRRAESRQLRQQLMYSQKEQTLAESTLRREQWAGAAEEHRLNTHIDHLRKSVAQQLRWGNSIREDAAALERRAVEYGRSSDDDEGPRVDSSRRRESFFSPSSGRLRRGSSSGVFGTPQRPTGWGSETDGGSNYERNIGPRHAENNSRRFAPPLPRNESLPREARRAPSVDI